MASTCAIYVNGRPVLPQLFTDNMVMQQQSNVPIWGTARAGRTVTVEASWNKETLTTKADAEGQWRTTLQTPTAGGPYTVTISDGQKVTLQNVMIGEVWLCSGQSNMEMPVEGSWARVYNFEKEREEANQYTNIRLLQIENHISTQPSDEVVTTQGGWQVCGSESVKEFSATGYFFGRDLLRYRNVPIGLIDASWGGTFIEPWTSARALGTHPDMREAVDMIQGVPVGEAEQTAYYRDKMRLWQEKETALDASFVNGKALWAAPDYDDSVWQTAMQPCEWEKMGLGGFDGVVWYRCEVDIPADMAGRDLTLSLGWIDDMDITYFNGEQIGMTFEDARTSLYTVPARLVHKGRNVIAVRAIDIIGAGGMYSDAEHLYLKNAKGKTISLASQWKYKASTPLGKMPPMPQFRRNQPNQVTVLFNAMIHPLTQFPIRGAIWYQGCNNEHKGYQYRELLPLMISDWRSYWGYDFPFYIVQLANFKQHQTTPGDDEWAEVREAQALAAWHVENSGLACIIDIGDAGDIHPRNKQEVGRRLALVARANTYGEQIEYSGPRYRDYLIEGNKMRICFDHAQGLRTADGQKLEGFAIAGSDRQWHWADARIEGQTVVVSCRDVEHPVAVRYAWHVNPYGNLQNGDALPAVPFRTDDWPGISVNVRKPL